MKRLDWDGALIFHTTYPIYPTNIERNAAWTETFCICRPSIIIYVARQGKVVLNLPNTACSASGQCAPPETIKPPVLHIQHFADCIGHPRPARSNNTCSYAHQTSQSPKYFLKVDSRPFINGLGSPVAGRQMQLSSKIKGRIKPSDSLFHFFLNFERRVR